MPAFPPMPVDPNRRSLGTSGTHHIGDPSPSISEMVLGEVDKTDRTRMAALATISHAKIVAGEMRTVALGIHIDETIPAPERHRKAHAESAKVAMPFADTLGKTQGLYEKEATPLREKLVGPVGNFSDVDRADAMIKLRGMQSSARFMAIKRSIDKGSDLLAFILTRSDEFLVGDILSETEKTVIIDHWRKTRHPEEFARLRQLETDALHLERTGRLLASYQLSLANQAIIAGDAMPAANQAKGAPGPTPVNHASSMSLEARAKATTAMLANQGR